MMTQETEEILVGASFARGMLCKIALTLEKNTL
jgi:hypothetical protein